MALIGGFEDANPDVDLNLKSIAGGHASGFENTIRNRLEQDDPPSSFAWRPGGSLAQFSENLGDAGADVRRNAELDSAHVPEIRELCTLDGDTVAVPVSARRINCLFYNVDVVDAAGVDPSSLSSVPDLLDALDRVAANTDATPIAHAMNDPQTTLQLFEMILLAEGGRDAYRMYVDERSGRTAVRSALEAVLTIVADHVNGDAGDVWPSKAAGRLLDGDAAFLQQDSGAIPAARANHNRWDEATLGEDWDVVPFPGTEGIYSLDVHSFVYPIDEAGENPTAARTRTWLAYVGSRDEQRLFNEGMVSVPTRTDVEAEAFDAYFGDLIRELEAADHRPPSFSRGLAVEPSVHKDMKRNVGDFLTGPRDLDSGTDQLLNVR